MNTAQLIQFQKPAKPKQEAIVDIQKNEDGYTPLPNFICDEGYLAVLDGDAVKCLVLLNRHIKGFHIGQKAMGEALVMKVTGIKDKRTVRKYMAQLAHYQLVSILKENGRSHIYTVTFNDRLPIKPVASHVTGQGDNGISKPVACHVPSTSNAVTCHVTAPVACHVPTTSNTPCHPVKEIDLKENIKINNDDNAHETFVPQERGMLQFIEYHIEDQKAYSLKELTQVYPTTQVDLTAQAKVSFPNLTTEQITGELKKLAQWSLTAEKRISQKWMTTWLNWLTNAEKPSQQTKPAAAPKTQKPPRHRYGQGVVTPQTGIKTVGGNHE